MFVVLQSRKSRSFLIAHFEEVCPCASARISRLLLYAPTRIAAYITKYDNRPGSAPIRPRFSGEASDRLAAPRQSAMASPSIASLFAARLRELEELDRQSRERTAQTLASVRATIAELEALELPTE